MVCTTVLWISCKLLYGLEGRYHAFVGYKGELIKLKNKWLYANILHLWYLSGIGTFCEVGQEDVG